MRLLSCWFRQRQQNNPQHTNVAATTLSDAILVKPPNFNISSTEIYKLAGEIVKNEAMIFDKASREETPAFLNVIVPLANFENKYRSHISLITFLRLVSANKNIRQACTMALSQIYEQDTKSYTKSLYLSICAVRDNENEMAELSKEDKLLVKKLVTKFNKLGAVLDSEKHARLVSIGAQINSRVEKFCHNNRTDIVQMLFHRSELNGLPHTFFKDRRTRRVGRRGTLKYIVTTSILDFIPVVKLATSEETRKQMYTAYIGRSPENMQLLQETVLLRLKAARILGYENYSEWVLQDTMAKSPDAVIAFLADLEQHVGGLTQIDSDGLIALKMQEMDVNSKPYQGFYDWDKAYYTNKMTRIKYGVDSEVVRTYLPLRHVLERVLAIYETMLGLRLVYNKGKTGDVWHPDVDMYEVWEAHDMDIFVGYVYLDLYFRNGKPTGSGSTFHIRQGFEATKPGELHNYPAAAVLVDLPNPANDPAALLSVGQVKTLVHELGHAFHIMCSKTKWSMLQGTSGVEQDFVEVPALIMERLFTQPSVFRQLTFNYKTGALMPDDLVQKLCDYEQQDGMSYKELLLMARYDLAIHSTRDGKVNCSRLYQQMSNCPAGLCDAAVVDHLMDSYSSMYYSYLWSSAYATRMLGTRFLAEEECTGSRVGAEYRREILQPGGTCEAQESLNRFLKISN